MSAFDDFRKDVITLLHSKSMPTPSGIGTAPAATSPVLSEGAHEKAVITSDMGKRIDPVTGEPEKSHGGIDISGLPDGAKAYAINDGTVVIAGSAGGYGNLVVLEYKDIAGNTHEIYYAHLASILVRKNQQVKKGQPLGVIGSTGKSTGRHLHIEHRINTVKHRASDEELQTAVNSKSLVRKH